MKKIFESIKKQFDENPGRFLGTLYPYVLILILVTGLFYISKLDVLSRHTVIPVLPDTNKVADLAIAEGKETAPVDIDKVSKATPELINKGKTLFIANCASCHGEGGNGDGPAGAALNPKPRNFHATEGWKNGRKIVEIYKTLQEGIKGSGMSAYDYLPAEDRFALLHYVRSFMASPPMDSPAELSALDNAYNLSKGSKLAGQIPVKTAQMLVMDEGNKNAAIVNETLRKIENDTSAEAVLFKTITANKSRALITLNNSTLWHQNQQEFVNLLSANIPINGFNDNVHKLSEDDISSLQRFMNKFYND